MEELFLAIRTDAETDQLVLVGDTAGSVADKVERANKKIQTSADVAARAIGTGMTAAGAAAALFARDTVYAASSFDSAMTASLAIMGDVTTAMRDDMAEAAREVARETRFSATDAAESYFYLASAGLDAKQSIEALPRVARFAQAGNFDMARATDLLTDAQSALGLTIRDDVVKNMESMVRVSDVLVRANTLSNATVQQFSESLTNKAGNAMRQLNIEVESGVAVLAAWADQGVKGTEAGERFNIVTRDLQTAARKNRQEFERLNIAVFDSEGNFRNMADIVADMESALAGMSAEQQGATLAALGFTDRSIAATRSLIGSSEAIRQYEADLRKAAGTTDDVAKKQLNNFNDKMGLLWDRINDVKIIIGKPLIDTILSLTDAGEPLIRMLERGARWFESLPKPVKMAAVSMAGITAASTLLGGVLLLLLPRIRATVEAFQVLRSAQVVGGLAAILGPAGLTGSVGGLVTALGPAAGLALAVTAAAGAFLVLRQRVDSAKQALGEFRHEVTPMNELLGRAFEALDKGPKEFEAFLKNIDPTAQDIHDLTTEMTQFARENGTSNDSLLTGLEILSDFNARLEDGGRRVASLTSGVVDLSGGYHGLADDLGGGGGGGGGLIDLQERINEAWKRAHDSLPSYFDLLAEIRLHGIQPMADALKDLNEQQNKADEIYVASKPHLDAWGRSTELTGDLTGEWAFRSSEAFDSLNAGIPVMNNSILVQDRLLAGIDRLGSGYDNVTKKSGGFFGGLLGGLGDVWKGLTGVDENGKSLGLGGLLKNIGSGIAEGFGQIISGGLSRLFSAGFSALGGLVGHWLFGERDSVEKRTDQAVRNLRYLGTVSGDVAKQVGELAFQYAKLSNLHGVDPNGVAILLKMGEILRDTGIPNANGFEQAVNQLGAGIDYVNAGVITHQQLLDAWSDALPEIIANLDKMDESGRQAWRGFIEGAREAGQVVPELRDFFNEQLSGLADDVDVLLARVERAIGRRDRGLIDLITPNVPTFVGADSGTVSSGLPPLGAVAQTQLRAALDTIRVGISEAIAQGLSFSEIRDLFGGRLDRLVDAMKSAGVRIPPELRHLSEIIDVMGERRMERLSSVLEANSDVVERMLNMGLEPLATQVEALQQSLRASLRQLPEDATTEDVLFLFGGQIRQLLELQALFGIKLDRTTVRALEDKGVDVQGMIEAIDKQNITDEQLRYMLKDEIMQGRHLETLFRINGHLQDLNRNLGGGTGGGGTNTGGTGFIVPPGPRAGRAGGSPGTAFENYGLGTHMELHGLEAVMTPFQARSVGGVIANMTAAAIRDERGRAGAQANDSGPNQFELVPSRRGRRTRADRVIAAAVETVGYEARRVQRPQRSV